MRKITTFVIFLVLLLLNFGFAHEEGSSHETEGGNQAAVQLQNFPLSTLPKDEFLFAVEPMRGEDELPLRVSDLKDITVIGNEIYILLIDGQQLVYTLDGTPVVAPQYPLIEHSWRFAFEEENGIGYSLEIANMEPDDKLSSVATDAFAIYTRDTESGEMIEKVPAPFGTKNFRLFDNQIAYRLKGGEQNHGLGTRFLLHTLENSSWDETKIFSQTNATVKSFDFSADGTAFSYIGAPGTKNDLTDSWITWGTIENGTVATSGSLSFPHSEAMNNNYVYMPWDMVTTNRGFIVLLKVSYGEAKEEASFFRYYSTEGELLHEVQVNHCVKKFAQLSDQSTLYLRMNEELQRLEIMKITWEPESKKQEDNSPQPIIAERTFQSQTLATFRPHLFGQLKETDIDTGKITYRALIHSDQDTVTLRIPYEDVRALCTESAENLRIEYQGFQLLLPMNELNCDALLAQMPCETEATLEIRLQRSEENHLAYTIEFFVVECLDTHTKQVHRMPVSSGIIQP